MYDEFSYLTDNHQLNQKLRELKRRLENVQFEATDYEEFEIAIDELNNRINHFARAFAKELRKLNGEKKEEAGS